MNIFLSSVGRRAYMVRYFKEVLGGNGRVFAGNSDPDTVAFQYADEAVQTPLIYSPDYIPFLLDFCRKKGVELLLSLFDSDLPVLAASRDRFSEIGVRLLVSEQSFTELCNDKWRSFLYFRERGFLAPESFLSAERAAEAVRQGRLRYPLMVKPRFGCGSIGLFRAEDEEALRFYVREAERRIEQSYLRAESAQAKEKVLIQECLSGREYGADIINDLKGGFQTAIIKEKLAMRAGETDIARTVDEPCVYEVAERLGRESGHIANLDCDLFRTEKGVYVLEMNARFGGGYPFSHLAGCRLPEALLRWHRGETVDAALLSAEPGIRGFKELMLTRG